MPKEDLEMNPKIQITLLFALIFFYGLLIWRLIKISKLTKKITWISVHDCSNLNKGDEITFLSRVYPESIIMKSQKLKILKIDRKKCKLKVKELNSVTAIDCGE